VTGTVVLATPAPSGGVVVTLGSSNPAVAYPPASVTLTAGQTKKSFTVRTRSVTTTTGVTISAAAGGVTKTATLTVRAK